MDKFAYHQWTRDYCEQHFKVNSKEGLQTGEAEERRRKYGPNSLVDLKKTSVWEILLRQLGNFFVVLLIFAAIISYLVHDMEGFSVLVLIVLANIAIGFFQENKAEKSLESLKNTLSFQSRVIRDKKVVEIGAEQIVPGDVVILKEGDKIPADIRLTFEQGLRVDEATLTGESTPVSKVIKVLELDTALGDRKNMVFAGTVVSSGRGEGIAVKIGKDTEFGKIASLVATEDEITPLEKSIRLIARVLLYVSIFMSILVFILGLLRGWNIWDISEFVIAFLVAAVPESLPTVVTLALAVGVMDMVKKKAIVRRLSVIEALGRVNIIATDKTGTLTKNELSIVEIVADVDGKFLRLKETKKDKLLREKILFMASLCSDSTHLDKDNFIGDPLEVAILRGLSRLNKIKIDRRKKIERISELPFNSDTKFMMTEVVLDLKREMIVKGAAEKVVSFCRLTEAQEMRISEQAHKMSKNGLKVIAIATKTIGKNITNDLKNMDFMALIGFADEPAEGIKEALAKTALAGIRTIIITGDHPETAKHVGNALGLEVADDEIITTHEMVKLSESGLKKILSKIKIIARATPEDKIRIVENLEKSGYTVAVTGDGVNDAPALKAATVGIAMGVRGTDVSKESADIILADDNFSTIVSAIAYGRAIFDNIKNSLIFLLGSNFNEIFLISISFMVGLPTPLTAIQIIWINLITDSFPALAMAFDKPSRRVLRESPHSSGNEEIKSAIKYSAILGVVGLISTAGVYFWGLTFSVDKARTLTFVTIVISQMLMALSIHSKERFWQNPLSLIKNPYLNLAVFFSILIQFLLFTPYTRSFFNLVDVSASEISVTLFVSIFYFVFVEISRFYWDKRK